MPEMGASAAVQGVYMARDPGLERGMYRLYRFGHGCTLFIVQDPPAESFTGEYRRLRGPTLGHKGARALHITRVIYGACLY